MAWSGSKIRGAGDRLWDYLASARDPEEARAREKFVLDVIRSLAGGDRSDDELVRAMYATLDDLAVRMERLESGVGVLNEASSAAEEQEQVRLDWEQRERERMDKVREATAHLRQGS